ncbi:transposase [Aurantimonas manganoxydans SI85-9A1]|uniref:Transposase n=1 Tax=Aurantimonas manganoxydans (strain ATCC BAA-1229 / DSM 21871 / SI85-9A1) TaxID=287752 RepID=Q1YJ45_AURMS|nr:transposase [Aurantimonas manganoxydans SI85-9A1]
MSKAPDGPYSRVEVITSVQRRRRWLTAEKVRLVEEAMQPGMSVSFVARQAGVSPSQLFAWKRRMLEGGHAAVQADEDVVGTSRVRDLEKRVRDLERLLGRKTMENEILKEALDVARPKKRTSSLLSWSDPVGGSR